MAFPVRLRLKCERIPTSLPPINPIYVSELLFSCFMSQIVYLLSHEWLCCQFGTETVCGPVKAALYSYLAA